MVSRVFEKKTLITNTIFARPQPTGGLHLLKN